MMNIRTANKEDAPGITKVHVASWQAAYKEILPEEFLKNISFERRLETWSKALDQPSGKHGIFVAVSDQEEIIGFATGGANRSNDKFPQFEGELYAIYLLSSAWGNGIGEKLTKSVVKKLVQDNMTSMLIWVLADNPACSFYEKMGGKIVGKSEIEIAGGYYKEQAYGWESLADLF